MKILKWFRTKFTRVISPPDAFIIQYQALNSRSPWQTYTISGVHVFVRTKKEAKDCVAHLNMTGVWDTKIIPVRGLP